VFIFRRGSQGSSCRMLCAACGIRYDMDSKLWRRCRSSMHTLNAALQCCLIIVVPPSRGLSQLLCGYRVHLLRSCRCCVVGESRSSFCAGNIYVLLTRFMLLKSGAVLCCAVCRGCVPAARRLL
jgi:hypothetical protein